jgi:hypothetical protein
VRLLISGKCGRAAVGLWRAVRRGVGTGVYDSALIGDLVRFFLVCVVVERMKDGSLGILDAIETIDRERKLSSAPTTRILLGLPVSSPDSLG